MSNRILGVLVMIGIIGVFILFYLYFFVYYTSKLTIISNTGNYKVTLKSNKIGRDFTCKEKICKLDNIAPLKYKLIAQKDNYKSFYKDIGLYPRKEIKIDIELEKEILLKKVNIEEKKQETKNQKINRIVNNKKYYSYFDLGENLRFYFKLNKDKLKLFLGKDNNKIDLGIFSKVDRKEINIRKVNNTNYIFLSIGKEKYLLNIDNLNKRKIDINLKILYIKSGKSDKEFILITEKGAFLYSYTKNKLNYFYLFKDFVYLKDGYIGIIYSDETKKLNNFGWKDKKNNLVIKYNPISKKRTILYETKLEINKIIKNQNDIYIYTDKEKYKLDNY